MNEVVEMSATLLGLLGLVEIAQVLILALKYLPFLCFIYVKLFSSNSTEATSIGIFMEKKSRFSIDSDADTSLYVKDRRNAPAKKSYTEPTSIVLVMFHCGRRKTAYHWPTFFFFWSLWVAHRCTIEFIRSCNLARDNANLSRSIREIRTY